MGSASTAHVTDAASYLAVSKWAFERLSADEAIPPGYVRIGEAVIHESARLHAAARFIGPALVGRHCRIEEDALVIGPTSLGAGCLIGRQAVVCRSVLWTSCRVGAGAVLDHCILADGANVDGETVMREAVCVARPPRRAWREHLRSLLGRRRVSPALEPCRRTARCRLSPRRPSCLSW